MDYIEAHDQNFSIQVLKFRDKIAGYKVLFGLTDDGVTAIKKEATIFFSKNLSQQVLRFGNLLSKHSNQTPHQGRVFNLVQP